MKPSSVTIDEVLYHILMEEESGCFTVMELRDRYLKRVDPNGVSLPDLRMYLYDQVRKMINCGWVEHHSERKARGQRFVVLQQPDGISPKLTQPGKGMQVKQTPAEPKQQAVDMSPDISKCEKPKEKKNTAEVLQQMLRETRLDLLTSYGETERYAQMIQDLPELKATLESDLVTSRDNSSRLLGHINALESALQKIGAMG
ncbi:MAG: hypothetical protein CMI08_16335 [Oceanospirillaceae bacterium]|uniref:hypothetical protein n=1 Tax=unclassified Thalassolituus TaxID=2624967 RepID=UPI000C5AD587|nr:MULTISPECIES: hypothetical protein [unclassified Thalassolituus]MAY00734.1 hypothetical protein [Oceanospirillaceae bacterium]MBL36191.1 hypothetical protein [Oceanospirillaceae bacterium]MBS53037.1 hypothetical protein [Oceanospirillaceae bacterium]|tara:strand:- start:11113 stop:11715 length:603 start_codon:yes stop_codon:yes gene_type:complete